MNKLKSFTVISFFLVTTLALLSCDSTQTNLDEFGQGSLQMKSSVTNAKTTSFEGQSSIQTTDGTNEIEILEVKFFLEEFELDGVDDSIEFELEEVNDFIVNLPLDGSAISITQAEIPAGFYDEFQMEIEKPTSDVEVTDADFRDETGNYSVVVKGLYNGEDFTFRSSEDFEIEMDLNPPAEITEIEQSILFIEISVTSWFTGVDGMIMDPKELNNIEKINENIDNSFEAFEESDDDDDDDDDEDDEDDD